jgi:hypothetical protein
VSGPDGLAVIGRSEQADVVKGVSSSYACQYCCGIGFDHANILPGSATVGFLEDQQFVAYETDKNCYGMLMQPHPVTQGVLWSSTVPAAVTINSSGLATGVGAGQSGILAKWNVTYYYSYAYGCLSNTIQTTASATANVECRIPTGETTASGGWDAANPTFHLWNQTLTGTNSFISRNVKEQPGVGGSDTCHFPGSMVQPAALSEGDWNVETGNNWGPDVVGYSANAINYYRANNRAPCTAVVPQIMTINCPDGYHQYTSGNLEYGIQATTISVKRHNAATQSKTWP